jgi:hypothetical protein
VEEFKFNPITRKFDMTSDPARELFVAGEMLGGHRVVAMNSQGRAVHANHANPGHAGQICGVTLASALTGESVAVRSFGVVEDSNWQWNLANGLPLFLSTNGLLTQTVPASGFSCRVGYLVSPTQIFIDIHLSIDLI